MRKALVIIALVLVIMINISIYTNSATLYIPILSVLLLCCVGLFINETVNEQRKVESIKDKYLEALDKIDRLEDVKNYHIKVINNLQRYE